MSLTLFAAALALAVWFVFTFLTPLGLGLVHILLGAAAVLFVRGWALRYR